MEKSSKVVFIPADIGWNDVGSWNALDEVCEKDKAGNILKGNVLVHDCNDSIVYGQDRLVATLGLKNTVVVDTQDALLVCAKDRSQDIKKLVDEGIMKNDDTVVGILTGRQKEPLLPIDYHNDSTNKFAKPPRS